MRIVTGPIFEGENEANGMIQDRKNDQLKNLSTSSDVNFLLVRDCRSRHNF